MTIKGNLGMDVTQTALATEVFRAIRTKILYSNRYTNLKTLLFTSSWAGEGKSYVTANTAIALAQIGKKVIILDCDLRKPTQHQLFGKYNKGITNYLFKECPIEEIVQNTEIANLQLVASGRVPSNPSEMLECNDFTELIKAIRGQADYVLIDSPPILPVTDACILGSKADGILLVVGVGTVKPEMALRAKSHLEEAGGKIFGLIINRSETCAEQRAYRHYYEKDKKIAN